jgi:hypothetical protein
MSAGESLGPQFMYHYSPGEGERVASIKKHGLLPHDPTSGHSYAEESGGPAGVYLFHDAEQAHLLDDGDVWKVNVKGLTVHKDPWLDHANEGTASYSPQSIPPHRVEHLGPARGGGDIFSGE